MFNNNKIIAFKLYIHHSVSLDEIGDLYKDDSDFVVAYIRICYIKFGVPINELIKFITII